jgi:hypothetical protein
MVQETLSKQEQLQQEHSDRNTQTTAAGTVVAWCAAVHFVVYQFALHWVLACS